MELKECREQLDGIDRQILDLFMRRMEVCDDVADYKIRHDLPVLDAAREEQKLAALREAAGSFEDQDAVEELFAKIMELSRRRQERILKGRKP
ncbi:MAG: chorismate mutase [Lachnospiraceae bacterium]|nr:chorismate mutase [Lachnospiraceae bacterium]